MTYLLGRFLIGIVDRRCEQLSGYVGRVEGTVAGAV